jgi:NADPH:quinone reductase-like Zn-dependent oxidoreductase
MQALLFHRYGPPHEVLHLEDVDVPTPGDGEVLIRLRAASANPVEWHLVRGEPFLVRLMAGVRGPKDPFLGGDGAGVVEAVGPGVTGLAVGDEVFGTTLGSLAELARAKTARLTRKPEQLTFEQAASLPVAGCTALQALRDHAHLAAGQRVLIVGAAGGVGSFAVQIAKALDARVTGVCSTANVDFVRSLGADEVVDYTRDEPAGEFDVVLQLAGDNSVSALRRLLTPRGTLVIVGTGTGREGKGGVLGPLTRMAKARLSSRKNGKRGIAFVAKINTADLAALAELVASGKVQPVISRTYPLADGASAVADIESGHTRGKIVVAM